MKIFLSVIIILFSFQASADESVEVEGLLSWNENHFAEVTECATAEKYTFGVMASAPYFKLMQKSDELVKKGTILITVKGKSESKNIINNPIVLSIKNGSCKS